MFRQFKGWATSIIFLCLVFGQFKGWAVQGVGSSRGGQLPLYFYAWCLGSSRGGQPPLYFCVWAVQGVGNIHYIFMLSFGHFKGWATSITFLCIVFGQN